MLHVRPTSPALKVPIPERAGRFLEAAGERVRPSAYWTRRLADGSVEIVPEKPTTPERPKRPAQE